MRSSSVNPFRRPAIIQIRISGSEWDPLVAYAESQGMTVPQAARELLLTALSTNAQDAVFLASATLARHEALTIAFRAVSRAMSVAWEEMRATAIARGISVEGIE